MLLRVLSVGVVRRARAALGWDSKLLTVTCYQLMLILRTLPMDLGQTTILLKLEGFCVLLVVIDVLNARSGLGFVVSQNDLSIVMIALGA